MNNKKNMLGAIPDAKPVRVTLPLENDDLGYRTQGVLYKTEQEEFSLRFTEDAFPKDSLDFENSCILSVDLGGPIISLEASIIALEEDRNLILKAIQAITHTQMRAYFRVDTIAHVTGHFSPSSPFTEPENKERIPGQTLDMSGNGLLISFAKKPPEHESISLQIQLPEYEKEVISLLAKPTRIHSQKADRHIIAYHFKEIAPEDRDKIIGHCLKVQRRNLRIKA